MTHERSLHPHHEVHETDVCVVGGGMSGICAAIAAARNGARVVLIHDRPVFGGNASSEVRMWICGAHGRNTKETGILEEIQLENCRRNHPLSYSIWDSVLYEKVAFCEGLTPLMNCSVFDLKTEDDRITEVTGWQLTTYTRHTVRARLFIDCSGDSILGPLAGAEMRQGRESRDEFGEDIAPPAADLKTMGNTILLQLEETDQPQPFIAPDWAYTFDDETHLPDRLGNGIGANFWWLELGGLQDTIADAEHIQRELYRTVYGVWDYMKNRGSQRERLRNWKIHNVSSMPGKRENLRYVGPHILTQHDVRAEGRFDDIIAYGGWTMDDHHPAGLYYPGSPTLFHHAPSPYGIPFRCLYSRNIRNLLCAGRNISTTHVALSSTRVMATCSLLGQAAGTAAALGIRHGEEPAKIAARRIGDLQKILMDDDIWLPWHTRPSTELTRQARITANGEEAEVLRNGHERPIGDEENSVTLDPAQVIEFRWAHPVEAGAARIIFDSDLGNQKKMPCNYPRDGYQAAPPKTLVKSLRIEGETSPGAWETLFLSEDLCSRLVILPIQRNVRALRFVPLSTWGAERVRIFSIDVLPDYQPKITRPPRTTWHDVMARVPEEDLETPELERQGKVKGCRYGA